MDIQQMLNDLNDLIINSPGANVLLLRQVVDGIQMFMSRALGIIVWCLIAAIPLTTALDVVFFLLPFTHGLADNYRKSKVRLVTRSAYKAYADCVKEGESDIFKYYIKRRMVDYISASVLLALILSNLWDSVLLWMQALVTVIVGWIMGVF